MECEAIWIRDIDQQKGGHKKLETLEVWIWRKMEKICQKGRITNVEVLTSFEEEIT